MEKFTISELFEMQMAIGHRIHELDQFCATEADVANLAVMRSALKKIIALIPEAAHEASK